MPSNCLQHFASRVGAALAKDAGISPADGWQTSTTNDGLWRNLLTRAWHMGRLRLLAFDELGTKPTPKAPRCMCRCYDEGMAKPRARPLQHGASHAVGLKATSCTSFELCTGTGCRHPCGTQIRCEGTPSSCAQDLTSWVDKPTQKIRWPWNGKTAQCMKVPRRHPVSCARPRQVPHVKMRPSKAEKQRKAKPAKALQHGASRTACHVGLGLLLPRMQASVLPTVGKPARQMMGSGETS